MRIFKKEEKTIIGICGVNRGVGAMHTALTMANYLRSKKKRPVIFIELSEKSRIYEMVCENKMKVEASVGYGYMGVKYIVSSSINEAMSTIRSTKDNVIVLIENLDKSTAKVWNVCHKKMVIGSMKPWNKQDYVGFIREKIIKEYDMRQISFYGNSLLKKETRDFNKMYECQIKAIPYIEDPFSLSEKDFKRIESIF